MEAELSDPDPTADFLKCQIKSFEGAAAKRPVRLKNEFLKYACECRIPVVLVLVESVTGQSWFCWLQGCIEANRLRPSIYGSRGSTTITADWLVPLDEAGNAELKSIARGIHPIARAMHVRDLVRFALETHDHDLVGAANRLLSRYQKEISYFPVDLVLDEVLSLGNRIWATLEGNALAELLYMLARAYGGQFSLEQIRKLVLRGDGYSRTGINALGIMYDEFPDLMKAHKLGEAFEHHDDWRVTYFCKLREKHSGVPVMALITGGYDCSVDGRDLHPSARDRGLSKWANRGDCAILDFAYEVE